MAGRGRSAVLPAWMKAAGGTPAAPGSVAAAPVAAPAARPAAAAPAFVQAAAAPSPWSEHVAPDGRKYYYNAETKQSSWTKPPELLTPEERAAAAAAAAPAAAPIAAPAAAAADWKEFTAPDGRKYYYNAKTKESRWEMPAEMRQSPGPAAAGSTPPRAATRSLSPAAPVAALAAPAAAAARPAAGSAAEGFVPRPGSIQPGATPHFATAAEAKDAFKGMLLEAGVSSSDGWAEVSRAVMADRRFGALRTLGERKAAFNEYVQQRRREEADAARIARLKAKEAFYELLDACAELAAAPGVPTFARAQELLSLDARWVAAGDAREREDLFADWAEEKQSAARERARAARRAALAAFASCWRARAGWRRASRGARRPDRLEGEAAFEALEPADRLAVFKEVAAEREAREAERRARDREARARAERANRAAFRELLAKKSEEGLIHARSRWRQVRELLAEEPALLAVEANASGARPRELFEDLVLDLEDAYLRDREVLKRACAARGGVEVALDAPFEEFAATLRGDRPVEREPGEAELPPFPEDLAAELEALPQLSWRLYHEELLQRAKEDEARRAKQARYRREDFTRMLRHDRRIVAESTFEEAQEWLKDEPEWKDLASDAERKELFDAFVERLKVDPSQVPVDPIVLYGSEMEALHVASALPPSLQCRTVVISPSGKWLSEWGSSLKRLGSLYVRSPITQHPGAAPGAFKDWIEKTGRQAAAPVIPSWAADQGDLLAGIRSFDAIDMQTERLEDERVVVVGGGMRAATLALAAAERGAAAVTLVSRRTLQQAAFEVDVGWQGPKLMVPFRAETDAAVRLARCRAAHGQASIHRPLWDRLAAAIGSGAIELVEGAVVERVEAAGGGAALHLGATQGLHVARPRPSPMGEAAQHGSAPAKICLRCDASLPSGFRSAAKMIAAGLKRLGMAGASDWESAAASLARLAPPNAAMLPPPESEGALWQAPRKQAPVAVDPGRIDVRDLDPRLTRKEVEQYYIIDDGFDLTVVLPLDEPVPTEQVRSLFGWQSLEVWAVGPSTAFHLHVPKLWARIIPGKCSVKSNTRSKKLYVRLYKERDAEWRYLKGF
ncbi:hypothetical protein QBZ16_000423 [Prototheca wickerhamii]|uniref:L-ornithine N(5)-monooxygenase n=1 Tax=Prototheca wickerhamii TaxID=3111 RepID=A0AAD9IL45_PROWI|nr:hypothetical protein QBZ16_000423 [Prototheca wickerhamii]